MAVQILLSQSGAPAGSAGVAREDFVTGAAVVAQAVGGSYSQYRWSFIDRPPDMEAGTDSAAALSAPSSSSTNITPIDNPGTYLIQVSVDSGQGLGATEDDVASITFYAGDLADETQGELNPNPALLPRRWPAFGEKLQHNVPDAIFPAGNRRGWAQEMLRWNVFLRSLFNGAPIANGRPTNLTPEDRTTSGTGVLADIGKALNFGSSSPLTYTVPPHSSVPFPIGTLLYVERGGTGSVTLVEGPGVLIESAETLVLRKLYSGCTLHQRLTDVWRLLGDTNLAP